MRARVVVFGESSKGAFACWHQPRDLSHLEALLGHPPAGSQGLFLATQAVLLEYDLLFLRVDEEGYSPRDYWKGVELLSQLHANRVCIDAIGLPGVGDWTIIRAVEEALRDRPPLLLTREADVYDWLSSGEPH